jgi:hypothetical protein
LIPISKSKDLIRYLECRSDRSLRNKKKMSRWNAGKGPQWWRNLVEKVNAENKKVIGDRSEVLGNKQEEQVASRRSVDFGRWM